jgi:hypothetical protein
MISTKRILAVAAVLVLAGLSCNSLVDDPESPNVVLEAENLTIPPVTAARDTTTGTCTITVTNASATFKNKPKNEPAGNAPYQDITLFRVVVDYTWDPSLPPLASREFGIGGSIPANGSATAQFAVIDPLDIGPYLGSLATLTLTFSGRVVSGETVTFRTGGFLTVNSCL